MVKAEKAEKTKKCPQNFKKKLRMDGELFYEKIDTIWTFCKYGKKKQQIDEEIKKVYKESEQKLIKKVSDAYTKSGGSVQALQELLKGLPIPAKFAQKTEKSSTEVQGSMQSIV